MKIINFTKGFMKKFLEHFQNWLDEKQSDYSSGFYTKAPDLYPDGKEFVFKGGNLTKEKQEKFEKISTLIFNELEPYEIIDMQKELHYSVQREDQIVDILIENYDNIDYIYKTVTNDEYLTINHWMDGTIRDYNGRTNILIAVWDKGEAINSLMNC